MPYYSSCYRTNIFRHTHTHTHSLKREQKARKRTYMPTHANTHTLTLSKGKNYPMLTESTCQRQCYTADRKFNNKNEIIDLNSDLKFK